MQANFSALLSSPRLRPALTLMVCLGASACAWGQTASGGAAASIDWASVLSGGAIVGLIGYIARPTAQTIKDLRSDIESLRGEIKAVQIVVAELRESNTHLRVVFTALSTHYNRLRSQLLEENPNAQIPTIPEIVRESQVPLQQVGILDQNATPIQRP